MGQFNLRWNNHITNILQVFVEHLSSESLVDVTLSCEGRFIKAHKIILSACSPYFQELFQNHTSKHPVIILNGIKYEDLQSMIRFMYNGEIRVDESELTDLLATAETLQVKGLCNVREKEEKPRVIAENEGRIDSADVTSKNESSCPQSTDSCKSTEEKEKSRPRKRRKMSHTVNELANEPIFTSQKAACIDSEESNIPPDAIDPEPVLIQDTKSPNEGIKKLNIKTKSRPERQTVIYGENGPEKIRRPPNAFMIFANEWRRRLATEHPRESNTEISVRLGAMWKSLGNETKDSYYALAKKVDEEHKRKYPGYYYSPKEARMRKNLKNDMMLARCFPNTIKNGLDGDTVRFAKVYINGRGHESQVDVRNEIRDKSDVKDFLNDVPEVRDDESISFA